MSNKPTYEHLAQFLRSLQGYGMLPQHERDMLAQAAEALSYLSMVKDAHDEWLAKTEWVQKTAAPGELGMHRADVLKQRIEKLQNSLATLSTTWTEDPDNVWVLAKDPEEPNRATLRRKNLPGNVHLNSTREGVIVDLFDDSDDYLLLGTLCALDEDLRGEEN